jgi:hypothetical protein
MKKRLAKFFNLFIIDFGVIIGQMTSSQNQIGIIVEKAKPVDDFRPDSPYPGRPQDFFPGRGGLIRDVGPVLEAFLRPLRQCPPGKVRKVEPLRIAEEKIRRLPAKGWAAPIRKPHIGLRSAAMIRKGYEVDPMVCPKCGGRMKVVAFITDDAAVDLTSII